MPFLPLAPAILGAIYNATGQWMEKFQLLQKGCSNLFIRLNEADINNQ